MYTKHLWTGMIAVLLCYFATEQARASLYGHHEASGAIINFEGQQLLGVLLE